MYHLLIEDDEGKSTRVPLPPSREEITIGRKEGNTIRLTERNISRFHAKLVRSGSGYFIEDKGSYNGVKVNGDKISGRRYLKEGDEIYLGDYRILLEFEKDREAPPPSATTAPQAAPQSPPRDRGRLCVLSGEMAGKIFPIERDEVLIGRTDENDIIIGHRSISRNHAKIVLGGEAAQIIDLGSANGVRVNGEEFGKTAISPGDKIDLGQVRLRFVGPGESFGYEPSMKEEVEEDDDLPAPGGAAERAAKPLLFILPVALAVIAAVLFYLLGFFG
jgi:ABC transport system ATP-binding/permease protein